MRFEMGAAAEAGGEAEGGSGGVARPTASGGGGEVRVSPVEGVGQGAFDFDQGTVFFYGGYHICTRENMLAGMGADREMMLMFCPFATDDVGSV